MAAGKNKKKKKKNNLFKFLPFDHGYICPEKDTRLSNHEQDSCLSSEFVYFLWEVYGATVNSGVIKYLNTKQLANSFQNFG